MGTESGEVIQIAFCFDENMMRQACVAIGSLLDHKSKSTHFDIYCVCTKKAQRIKDLLESIVRQKDSYSKISFYLNTMNLEKGFEIRGITVSTYYRLSLHQMFPQLKRIIYSDVDILFLDDISEVWHMNLDNNLLAGVKADVNIREVWDTHYKDEYWKQLDDWFGQYINAGFIIMNLEEMRKRQMEKIWYGMYEKAFFFQDQDILNITCRPYIVHFPMKYNRMMFYTNEELSLLKRYKVVGWKELEEALDSPAVVHYAGKKPWNAYDINGANLWWEYVIHDEMIHKLFRRKAFCYRLSSFVNGILERLKKDD